MTKARDLADFIASGTIAQTVTADGVDVGDNERIRLGDSQDLQLFHNGSASYITDSGTGNLVLQTSSALVVQNSAGTETMLQAFENGAVNLYHDNSVKIATTSTGINVTGNVTATQSQNAETNFEVTNTDTGADAQVRTKYTTDGGLFTVGKTSDAHSFGGDAYLTNVDNTNIRFATNDTERFRIGSSGELGIGGATYGTSGQVLTSGGTGAAPTWTTINTSFTTNVITTNTTATKDNHYYLNAASITLTLPASPSVGDEVRLSEVAGNTDCIVGRNSSNIMGAAEDLTLDTAYVVLSLRYVDATIGWAFS